jgi:PKD repeat protein
MNKCGLDIGEDGYIHGSNYASEWDDDLGMYVYELIYFTNDLGNEPPTPTPTPTPTPIPTICESCGTTPPMERELNAKFERTPKVGDCPLNVTFTDVSETYLMRNAGEYEFVEQPYNRTWDFGDGTVIENASAVVTHEYTTVGKYSVTLTIDNGTTSSLLKQINSVYVTGAMYPNPTTTFGAPAMTLNNANYNATKYAEILPLAYTGLFNTTSSNAWFFFWGLVFMFIFLAIFVRVEDTSLVMLFGLLVAGTIMALLPTDFRMIGQGLLILAIASVIYVLIKGRFK